MLNQINKTSPVPVFSTDETKEWLQYLEAELQQTIKKMSPEQWSLYTRIREQAVTPGKRRIYFYVNPKEMLESQVTLAEMVLKGEIH